MSLSQALILIVEDDPTIAGVLCEVLEDHGYHCITARSVAAALDLLETLRPALITLDLNLPEVRGYTLLTHLRAHDGTRGIPIVVISAEQNIDEQVRAASQAVVHKPFDLDQLLKTVRHVLGDEQLLWRGPSESGPSAG